MNIWFSGHPFVRDFQMEIPKELPLHWDIPISRPFEVRRNDATNRLRIEYDEYQLQETPNMCWYSFVRRVTR